MGCFDSVWVPCPTCGTGNEFQSKGGDCLMRNYEFNGSEEIPADVMSDVNRHAPIECAKCGTQYEITLRWHATVAKIAPVA